MAIRANVQIEGFSLNNAYCRIVSAELRRGRGGLVCDFVVDIMSASDARRPVQKRGFRNISITDGAGAGVRQQLYEALKRKTMFANAEDA